MLTRTVRLALATALLWLGFGACGRAEAATMIQTPEGLTPGESFRIVFVTDGTTVATSTNIATYNTFVNAQAAGATYNGAVLSWDAIASTASVNAINNVGQTTTPVYLADGTLITTSTTTSGLWSGSLLNPIDEDLSGTLQPALPIWTGTGLTGSGTTGATLGGTKPTLGFSGLSTSAWVDDENIFSANTFAQVYAISQVLTVPGAVAGSAVPEPAALLMAGTGISAVFAIGWYSRRREERRQRPVSQPDATE